jgi:hypothetical protein
VIDGAYRLRSDQPVTVYQYNPFAATVSNDASLLIPVNAWGKKIVVASSTEAFDYPSFYAVVAAHDLTTVTLTPSGTGKSVLAGGGVMADGTGQLVLDRGDVLQVLTDSGDLTGTVVDADKPVQVIGGSKCLFAPINVFACDHGEESIFPVDTLAKTYVIVPPAQYPNGVQENPQIVRVIASEDNTTLTFNPDQPVNKVLAKAQMTMDQIDVIELNEAFASVSCACASELSLDPDKVNPNGGAIALGHPVGATGAILTVKLMHELERTGGRYGIVSLCIGGGQGIATIFERLN